MKRVFVIAEAGINHNGRLDLALKLCGSAKKSGADAVKFQTFKTEKVVSKNAKLAEYQKKNIDKNISLFDMVKKFELSYDSFRKIKEHCGKIGIQFLSTPDDSESLEFLLSLGMERIKVSSGAVTDIPLLRKIGSKRKQVILSTGMSNLDEVKKAYATLLESGAKHISILHCTTSYPVPFNEANLRVIPLFKRVFNTEVGYSDHTLGINAAVAAVALGATIIEKHFTLDRNMPGPDHKASLEPAEFSIMVNGIREIEKALGAEIKKPTKTELKNIKFAKRSILAARPIRKGEIFSDANIIVKIAPDGLNPEEWDKIIGRKAKKNFDQEELIRI